LQMERIFPMKFNNELSIDIDGKLVYPMFILYISKLDLFLSVNNIVKTCLKVEGMSKCVKIKGPLQIFLKILIFNYRKQLEKIKEYIQNIRDDYEQKNDSTFYNYNEMLKKIEQKIVDLNIYMTRRQTINKKFQPGQIRNSSIQNYVENKMNNQLQPNQIPAQKEMENFIKRKKTITNFKKDLKEYLFDFCQLKPEEVDSLAVF